MIAGDYRPYCSNGYWFAGKPAPYTNLKEQHAYRTILYDGLRNTQLYIALFM